MNKVIIEGRIATTLELRKTRNNNSVLSFNVAVKAGRGENEHPIFVNMTAWKNTADFIERYFDKGDQIIIVGSLDINQYEKSGVKINQVFVNIDEVYFGAKKNNAQVHIEENESFPEIKPKVKNGIMVGDEEIKGNDLPFIDDEDLPFL